MFDLITRARRRFLHNELLAQGSVAFCAALGLLIVLLLLGTEVLNWYWTLTLPLAAVGYCVYRAYKRLPSGYRVAQTIDRRLALSDTLSTAFFFSEIKGARLTSDLRDVQLQRAEQVASRVDIRQAAPYVTPRSAYAMAALFLAAASLFALRYGFGRKVALGPPIVRAFQEHFSPADKTRTASKSQKYVPPFPQGQDDDASASADPDQKGSAQKDSAGDDAAPGGNDQSADKSGDSKDGSQKQSSDAQNGQDGQGQQQADNQDQQDSAEKNPNASADNKSEPNSKQSDGKQKGENSSDSSSLMSKMKDAFQNMFSRPKPQNNGQQDPQSAQNQNAKQGGQQNGSKQQSKDGQSSSQSAEGQEGQQADNQDAQDSQGKGQGKSDAQQANKQPGSGVGSQDGSKQIHDAQMLNAMGKISELIGKRSASVTGESTVEVQNTSQQLHTEYLKSGAQHAQGGSEINRDEVPVALQPYVEQYFNQLRKLPSSTAPAVKKK